MADLAERETKLIQYLNEAYGKERQLETALRAHMAMTPKGTYRTRLDQHRKETTAQAKGLKARIKELGGKAEETSMPGPDVAGEVASAVTSAAKKGAELARGPLHALRGTGEQEKLLKNAKTEFANEAEEIANYQAIEALGAALNDKETVKLAREYRRQEERMANFLEKLIPRLTNAVVKDEIPAAQRRNGNKRSTSRRSSSSARGSSNGGARRSTSRTASGGTTRSRTASSASSSRAKSGSSSRAKTGSSSRAKTGSSSRAKTGSSSRGKASTSRAKSTSARSSGTSRARKR